MIQVKRALLSVSDKTGVVDLARFLAQRGVELVSTGGTMKALADAGLAVRSIDDLTGFPEMMDGRVKTLHPKVHGGLLGRLDIADHVEAMKKHGIEKIDLVVINLYPFAKTVVSGADADHCIENIDIGGPSMLRSAAKNHPFTAVVCDPSDYALLMKEIEEKGGIDIATSRRLAAKVFNQTASYDAMIADWFNQQTGEEEPALLTRTYEKVMPLRYGENPHQKAAYYRPVFDVARRPDLREGFEQIQGKELSFNNLLDLSAAFQCSLSLPGHGVVIVKHLNPCGAAFASDAQTIADAFIEARKCDPVSAFGGIIAVNGLLDEKTAKLINEQFAECVIATAYSDEALKFFADKKNLRVLKVDDVQRFLSPRKEFRQVMDGMLFEDMDVGYSDRSTWTVPTKRKPTEAEWSGLNFAWRLVKYVKSNAIVFTNEKASLGIGAGQMSRVDAAEIAASKAARNSLDLSGSCVASDAFFPFRDGLDVVAKAGAKAVIQPGGSVRDEEVIAAADEQGIAMVFTGMRHFRH